MSESGGRAYRGAKNLVLCSDGTGNSGGKARGTNVWRLFNAVDRYGAADADGQPLEQRTFYDDGVGTDTLRWARALGGAFGWGLSRNLRQLYTFLVMNYEKGDQVFLFGFSRGAFTVRSLAGMICRCGLLDREAFLDLPPGERERALARTLRAYRSATVMPAPSEGETAEARAHAVRRALAIDDLPFRDACIPIHFIGVWDTVDAVGLPFDDVKVVDWIWRRLFKRRLWGFHDRTLSAQVHHAYHALALDDERRTFHPNVWDHENAPADPGAGVERARPSGVTSGAPATRAIEQVWFAGVHSNFGGGYAKDSLSLVSLDWMMGKAERHGLRLVSGRRQEYRDASDAQGRLYDSRTGVGVFYRYAARNLYERPADPPPDDAGLLTLLRYTVLKSIRPETAAMPTPHIHASVFERIARGTDDYAPKVIRERHEIAWTDGGPFADQDAPPNGAR